MTRSLLTLSALVALASSGFAADAKPADAAATPYPFTTCAVSGEAFGGDMGDPYVFTHEGREVKLCCKSCLKAFKKDPAKYVAALDEGAKAKAEGKAPVNPAEKKDEKKKDAHGHGDHQH